MNQNASKLKLVSLSVLMGSFLSPTVLAVQSPVQPLGQPPTTANPPLVAQAPLEAAVQIRLTADRLNVRIINQSSTPVFYTAAGDTPSRSLARGSEVLLRQLRIPTSLLFAATDQATGDRLFYNITVQAEGEGNGLRIILRDGGENEGRTAVFVDTLGKVFVD
ncbi:hypothetical protein [Leptolyngbya ohadii]|uniref:hypothetical protein n=1 Tax=Leptolyngbya ohadii TaxID=1962290 RepID=UPI000B59A063|nr:hypothetical protein [Leptolyngbya ohadii]